MFVVNVEVSPVRIMLVQALYHPQQVIHGMPGYESVCRYLDFAVVFLGFLHGSLPFIGLSSEIFSTHILDSLSTRFQAVGNILNYSSGYLCL